MTRYFVTPGPGHYGDRARVISSHRSEAAALRAAGRGFVVRRGQKQRGDEWLRAYEGIYPVVVGGQS